jgi:heavy metal translocating P-type ATPase
MIHGVPGPSETDRAGDAAGEPRSRLPAVTWRALGRPVYLAVAALAAIAVGGALALADHGAAAEVVWAAVTAVVLLPLTVEVAHSLLRRDAGVDAIALLAMATALALGEYLAGAVVGLMLSGGNALEEYAGGRAKRELRSLLERAPRVAHRYVAGGLEEIGAEEIEPEDRLLIRSGEVVPADCVITSGASSVDESAVTGESLPVSVVAGDRLRSGVLNLGRPLDVVAERSAEDSTYAGIVRLVRSAERERAPFVRLADRYAVVFLPVTLIVAAAAWIASGDEIRALAVLVVATPCPLILATPIAIISGVSRAARRGIVVKGGGAIEALGDARTILLDKTGTLTVGEPRISRIVPLGAIEPDRLLFYAASLDQASAHVLAESLVGAARARGLELTAPTDPVEDPGQGIEGVVAGRRVALGRAAWLADRGRSGPGAVSGELRPQGVRHSPLGADLGVAAPEGGAAGSASVAVAIDGAPAGFIELADPLRADAEEMIAGVRGSGVERLLLVTGDDRAVAERIAASTELTGVLAECTPEDKLEVVRAERARDDGAVVMVGDGVNDAPALALADVGIAMGARGATAASESADAVLTVDRVDRVADAVRIGRHALRVARQGIIAGMGMSGVAMGFAAFGYLSPIAGALLQEAIDVAVILNALRVLRD